MSFVKFSTTYSLDKKLNKCLNNYETNLETDENFNVCIEKYININDCIIKYIKNNLLTECKYCNNVIFIDSSDTKVKNDVKKIKDDFSEFCKENDIKILEIPYVYRNDFNLTLVQAIVITIFNGYKNMKNEFCDDLYESKKNVLHKFEDVMQSIIYYETEKKDIYKDMDNSLDILLKISNANNIRENLQKLIHDYLEYVSQNKLLLKVNNCEVNNAMIKEINTILNIPELIMIISE